MTKRSSTPSDAVLVTIDMSKHRQEEARALAIA